MYKKEFLSKVLFANILLHDNRRYYSVIKIIGLQNKHLNYPPIKKTIKWRDVIYSASALKLIYVCSR
jgi:hypothetical protein